MKRIVAAAAVVAWVVGSAEAAPIGPIRPEMGHWKLGGELGFQFDRDWERSTNRADKFEDDERFSYVGIIDYGLTEDWEVFGRLGAASLEVQDRPDGVSTANSLFDMGTEFAWGIGAQGILWHDALPNWDIGLHGQYFRHSSHDGTITAGTSIGNNQAANWDYQEWQIALLFQTEYEALTPYIGPTFGDAEIDIGSVNSVAFGDLDADDNVGIVVGTGWDFAAGWEGYVEGRFVDATAVNVGLLWTF